MTPTTLVLRAGALITLIASAAIGVVDIGRAMDQSRSLYTLDTLGLQAESELEYATQESRRIFLYALGASDPNEQLEYVDASRAAADRVEQAVHRLEALPGANGLHSGISGFRSAWIEYSHSRDEIVAHILADDPRAALNVDKTRGQQTFLSALDRLHALRKNLVSNARSRSKTIVETLWVCLAGLGVFLVLTSLIVSALATANRKRLTANLELSEARELDRKKARILEMIVERERLPAILSEVARMARQRSHIGYRHLELQ